MNKIFFITFVAISVLLSFNATAQEKKEQRHFDREAFEARRNAFITAEVGLTPEEAAQFIPLCNELRQKKFEVGRECRKLSKEIRHKENPTDADYNKVIDECLDVEIKEAQLEKEYFERFKKILSPEKVYKYRNAEYKFVRNFMKSGRDNKKEEKQKIQKGSMRHVLYNRGKNPIQRDRSSRNGDFAGDHQLFSGLQYVPVGRHRRGAG